MMSAIRLRTVSALGSSAFDWERAGAAAPRISAMERRMVRMDLHGLRRHAIPMRRPTTIPGDAHANAKLVHTQALPRCGQTHRPDRPLRAFLKLEDVGARSPGPGE